MKDLDPSERKKGNLKLVCIFCAKQNLILNCKIMLANYQQGPRICETPPLNPSKSMTSLVYNDKINFKWIVQRNLSNPKKQLVKQKLIIWNKKKLNTQMFNSLQIEIYENSFLSHDTSFKFVKYSNFNKTLYKDVVWSISNTVTDILQPIRFQITIQNINWNNGFDRNDFKDWWKFKWISVGLINIFFCGSH